LGQVITELVFGIGEILAIAAKVRKLLKTQ
jgi:hypothetical protein